MARRGVLILLGCAWSLVLAGTDPSWAAGSGLTDQPALLAQVRAPIVAQARPPGQQPRLISLDFKDADINNILRILAEFSGLNVVSSEDVKGKVTVKLQNVPWQQALDSVVRAAKLAYVQEGNIIRVDKLENLTKEAEAQFKAEQREVEIEQRREEAKLRLEEQRQARERAQLDHEFRTTPLVEEIIPLKYAHVGTRKVQVLDFLTDQVRSEERKGVDEAITGGVKKEPGKPAGLLSERGELTVDGRTNSLIVRDVPRNVEKIKAFVERLDRATLAVLIEARVVEIRKDDARQLGVVWGGAFTPRTGADSPVIDVRGGAGPRVARGSDSALPTPTSTASDFPVPPSLAFPSGNLFGLALGWLASNFALDIALQAMEGEGRARVISSPSLMTLENEPATIASGQKQPIISVIVVGGASQATVQYADVTTRLQVVPRVAAEDGQLVLTIAVKRDTLDGTVEAAGLNAPIIGTKQTITQVRIPDGGTIVISGLREDSSRNTQEGLPWVKDIPVLGWLFKNDLTEAQRLELVIFLTAKVVDDASQTAMAPAELRPAPDAPAPDAPPPPGPTGQAPEPASPSAVSAAASVAGSPPEWDPLGDIGGR